MRECVVLSCERKHISVSVRQTNTHLSVFHTDTLIRSCSLSLSLSHTLSHTLTLTLTHTHTHTHTQQHGLNLLIQANYGLYINTHTQCVSSGQRSNRNSSSLSGYIHSAWEKQHDPPE